MLNSIFKKILLKILNLFYPDKNQNEEFVHYFFFYLKEFTYLKYTFWEKLFISPSLFMLIYFVLICSFFSICRLLDIPFEPEKAQLVLNVISNRSLQLISIFGYTVYTFLIFTRYTKEIKKMSAKFESELNQHPGFFIQKRAMFTAAKFKAVKPVVLACIGCIAGTTAVSTFVENITGINPLEETGNTMFGLQTSEQAIDHISHPSKYIEGVKKGIPPFEQDRLKQELMKDLEKIFQEKK
jgi:hypothetical protein